MRIAAGPASDVQCLELVEILQNTFHSGQVRPVSDQKIYQSGFDSRVQAAEDSGTVVGKSTDVERTDLESTDSY
jgi:hypothetical protein